MAYKGRAASGVANNRPRRCFHRHKPRRRQIDGRRFQARSSGEDPCATCHGPEAKGNGEFPRLAGQLYDYIVKKLTNWTKERGQNPEKPDTSAIMQPIAHALTEPEIKAVAAYVSYLR
jgi:cytochrome c553